MKHNIQSIYVWIQSFIFQGYLYEYISYNKKFTKLQRNYLSISLYKRVDWATRQVSKLMHKRSWSLKNASDIFKQFKESRRILFDLWKQWWCWQYRILTATIIIHKRIVKHIILTVMWTVLSFFAQRYSAEFIT